MKTKSIATLFLLMLFTTNCFSQFSFGVSPGIGLNSAYFGYKIHNKLVPFLGFQYCNGGVNYEEKGKEYDWDLNEIVSFSNTGEFSGSVYIPNIGLKYFFTAKNKLQPYASLSFSKPFISGTLKTDGEPEKDVEDFIDNLSLWGVETGFGVEYFFDENFSLGGEFGLRYLHLKTTESMDDEIWNPETGSYEGSTTTEEYNFKLSPTFSKISLNFYF